jgi:membrane fusion protein, multidrug efflux system
VTTLRTVLQVLVPLAVLGGGFAIARFLASSAKPPAVVAAQAAAPLVRTARVAVEAVRLDVTTQGTVEPLRTVELSADVRGRIVATSEALRVGATFAADDVLLTLDPRDFDLALAGLEADVARAELALLQQRAEADAAIRAWTELEGQRQADPLVTRAPQIRDAEAALAAARAALARGQLDRERTAVKAPFAGRVRSVHADLGQTVQAGQRLAVLLDDRVVEVRLPIPLADAAYVDLPLRGAVPAGDGPAVEVGAEFAGSTFRWQGHVVRTEGEVDRRTRQLTVVARVEQHGSGTNGGPNGGHDERPPLLVGQFVHATIHGRSVADALVIPRAALRADGSVWVVDAERRLRRRDVTVRRVEDDRVVLAGGIAAGDEVCVSALDTATEGMPVRVAAPEPQREGARTPAGR